MRNSVETSDVITSDDFARMARGKEFIAKSLQHDKKHCKEAWLAAGFALEFLIKAFIMKQRRLNSFPSDPKSPLRTHNLRVLMKEAGLDQATVMSLPLTPIQKANIATALTWSREHEYVGDRMPRAEARSMVDAIFGSSGVAEWLQEMI